MAAVCYCGWEVSPDGAGIDRGFSVAGVTFPGGVRAGDVATAFRYLLTQYHARVEALVAGWCWGYSYKENANSPGSFSCHAAGVAVDVNAPLHGNGGSMYEGFTDQQVQQIRQILAECPVFQWGADYSGTKDAMHFEVIVDPDTLARVVAGLDNEQQEGFPMALTDKQQDELYDWVKALKGDLVPDGRAPGQTTVGSTIVATLKQTQANANKLNEIDGKL